MMRRQGVIVMATHHHITINIPGGVATRDDWSPEARAAAARSRKLHAKGKAQPSRESALDKSKDHEVTAHGPNGEAYTKGQTRAALTAHNNEDKYMTKKGPDGSWIKEKQHRTDEDKIKTIAAMHTDNFRNSREERADPHMKAIKASSTPDEAIGHLTNYMHENGRAAKIRKDGAYTSSGGSYLKMHGLMD